MFTKEISFTLPVAIVLYEFMFFESGLKSRAKRLLPYLLIVPTVPLLVSATDFEMYSGRQLVDILARATGSATQTEITSWEYYLTQLRLMPTYLRLLFLPINQNLDYDYPIARSLFEFPALLSFIGYLGLWAGGLLLARRKPVVSFGLLWFLLTLTPISLGIALLDLRLGDPMFEHRLYLPSVGLIVLGAASIVRLAQWRRALIPVIVALCLAFGGVAYARNSVWADEIML
jgi:hypothetical protein